MMQICLSSKELLFMVHILLDILGIVILGLGVKTVSIFCAM